MTKQVHVVSTDALGTLGTIIDATAGRDAVHLAVEPMKAVETLYPGQHVGLVEGGASLRAPKKVGIVDPFLSSPVFSGQWFWLVVFPRTITSLRHVWEHPDFPSATHMGGAPTDPVEASRAWIEGFAARLDQTYNRLMDAAETWLISRQDGEWGTCIRDDSETYKDYLDEFPEFWKHYEIVTGKRVDEDHRESFFTCSC